MRLLLHAITLPAETRPAPQGLRGGRLVRFECGDLLAWATELPDMTDGFVREDVLAHHEVVVSILTESEAILPARFPTLVDDPDALRAHVSARQDALASRLAHVHGCSELAVSVLWNVDRGAEPVWALQEEAPGRRYMLQRQQAFVGSARRRARARELSAVLEREVGSGLVEARHRLCPSEQIGLSSAFLVRRTQLAEAKARLVRAEQDVRILVNGPWPPYTFAAVGSD